MNNWRLLLLALVAVFQPISSFTERNHVDGRHQCCDRHSPTPFRDSRSSLHGIYRLDKTSAALRRLNDQDEIREGGRYELRQRDSVFTRPSRLLLELQEKGTRQGPSVVARASRVEYRFERIADGQIRDRKRERSARNIQDQKFEYQIRKVVDHTSSDALEHRDERTNIEHSRRILSRVDNRVNRFSNERLSKNMYNSELEMQREQIRSREKRFTPNKEARDVLRRTRDYEAHVERSNNLKNRQQITRERLTLVVRHETAVRADTRRAIDNNERRQLERHSEQRRSLSENNKLVDRNRDREDNRENRHRNIAHKRFTTERFDERRHQRDDYMESRQQNKENIDRRLSRERMSRRIEHETKNMNYMINQNKRNVDDRREIRNNEGMTRETRKEIRENGNHKLSQTRIEMDRKNFRDSRIMKTVNERDVDSRWEIRSNDLSKESRYGLRENPESRHSRERIQMDRRKNRESRMMSGLNERDVDSRREIRHSARIARDTRDERESPENRLSHERILLDRRNVREFRVMTGNMITRNDREIDSRREIRYNRLSRKIRDEIRENPDSLTERIQMDRRNIQEFRMMNYIITRNNKDIETRLESRYIERLAPENMETLNRRLSKERIQMDRRNTRESRMMNTLNERNVDSRREIRHNELIREIQDGIRENPAQIFSRERYNREIREYERLSGETRKIRENLNRRLARESTRMDRRHIRESKTINDMTTRNERDIESRREIRYNERLSRNIRNNYFTLERQVESRSLERAIIAERDNLVTDRRTRSVDRRNMRELRTEPKFSRSAVLVRGNDVFRNRVEHSDKIDNREREATNARFRNVESARNRETLTSKMETENDSSVGNWQYVLYTLQAAYLCALFMQMLTPSRTEKAHKMNLRWLPLPSHYNPIKVD